MDANLDSVRRGRADIHDQLLAPPAEVEVRKGEIIDQMGSSRQP